MALVQRLALWWFIMTERIAWLCRRWIIQVSDLSASDGRVLWTSPASIPSLGDATLCYLSLPLSLSLYIYIYVHIHIYVICMYTHIELICVYIYIYIHIYIYREREGVHYICIWYPMLFCVLTSTCSRMCRTPADSSVVLLSLFQGDMSLARLKECQPTRSLALREVQDAAAVAASPRASWGARLLILILL